MSKDLSAKYGKNHKERLRKALVKNTFSKNTKKESNNVGVNLDENENLAEDENQKAKIK